MRFLMNVIVCNQFFTILMLTLVFQISNSVGLQEPPTQSSYLVKVEGKGPDDGKYEHTILGIIIDKNIILSFAPKVLNPDLSPTSVTIKAGEESKPQIRQSVNITKHPCFPELNVAIIYLDEPLEFNKFVEPAWIPSNTDRITPESLKPNTKHIMGLVNGSKYDKEKGIEELKVELSPCGDDTSAKYLEICTNDSYTSHFIPSSVLLIEGPEIMDDAPLSYPYVAGFYLDSVDSPNNKDLKRFLDLTKLTCWMSGGPISCEEDPNIGTKACGKNLNDEWWINKLNATEGPTDELTTTDDESTEEENLEHLNKTTPDPNASNHLNKLDFYRIGLLTLIISICIFS